MEYKKQLSVEVINEFIHFLQINSNCCNDHCSVYNLLRKAGKLVDNTDKIKAFKKY